jgi:NhaC family Na+:H+ antiporter
MRKFTGNSTGLVASTVGTGSAFNTLVCDQYLSIMLTANIFKDIYEDAGYENRLLSRSVEDSATVTSVLVPWNTCGMTQATVLGVPTLTYLPYCFFNILSPLTTIAVAAIGWKIKRLTRPSAIAEQEN